MALTKFVALFDLHVGFERIVKADKTTVVPTHNAKAITTALNFIEYYQPEVFIDGGDGVDAGEIAHHNNRKSRLTEGFRFKDSLDLYDDLLIKKIDNYGFVKKKIKLKGNHERFVDDFLNENPSLEGLVSINSYLGLKGRGWECLELGECYKLGKLFFTHGEKIAGRYPADKALQMYHRNIRFGHLHTSAVSTYRRAYDKPDDVITAKAVPCLRTLNAGYTENNSHSHINGFLVGSYEPTTGRFTDTVIEMISNKFYYDGILFE